ncbi:hypothetical protein FQA39_LY18625 [Lamprigera yunnana]|nr:hypothetical protein FQA39_LY18625 [Lamprigera yunnana]
MHDSFRKLDYIDLLQKFENETLAYPDLYPGTVEGLKPGFLIMKIQPKESHSEELIGKGRRMEKPEKCYKYQLLVHLNRKNCEKPPYIWLATPWEVYTRIFRDLSKRSLKMVFYRLKPPEQWKRLAQKELVLMDKQGY